MVGDFNGDGVDEVVIFNGVDWAMPYLGLLVSDGAGGLKLIARYDGDIPGWGGFAPQRPVPTSPTSTATARTTSSSSTATTGR